MTIEREMRALMAQTPEQYRRHNDAVARRIAQHFAELDRADLANKTLAQRGADMPLRPKAPQRPRHELGDQSAIAGRRALFACSQVQPIAGRAGRRRTGRPMT